MVRSLPRFFLVLSLGLFLFACSDDDDGGTGPGGSTGDPEANAMVKAGSEATDFVSELSLFVEEWANGNFATPTRPADGLAKEATWSEELQAWLLQYEEFEDLTFPDNAGYNANLQIQYLADPGGPQQSHEGATSMSVVVNFLYSEGFFDDPENNSTLSVSMTGQLFVNGLDTATRSLSGQLGGNVVSEGTRNGDSYETVLTNLRLMPTLDLPVGVCPGGEISLNHSGYIFYVFLDGQGNFNWRLEDGAEQVLSSGSGALGCGG